MKRLSTEVLNLRWKNYSALRHNQSLTEEETELQQILFKIAFCIFLSLAGNGWQNRVTRLTISKLL